MPAITAILTTWSQGLQYWCEPRCDREPLAGGLRADRGGLAYPGSTYVTHNSRQPPGFPVMKSTSSASRDILVISIPGVAAIPLDVPSTRTWTMEHDHLLSLMATLGCMVVPNHSARIAHCGAGLSFPYRDTNGSTCRFDAAVHVG
jgi:hypothetical protein